MSFIQQTEQYYQHSEEVGELKRAEDVRSHDWLFKKEDLCALMANFQEKKLALSTLAQMGGSEGLVYALRSHARLGLGRDETEDASEPSALEIRRNLFGKNELPPHESDPFYKLCLDELKDPMLCVLVVAGVISLVIGATFHANDGGYIEGLAILIAVVIVVNVGAINNWQKEKQFRKMDEENKKKNTIVMRSTEMEIPWSEVVVGDLVILRNGFTVPADGVFVLGTENLHTEESSLTGESRELPKNNENPLLMKGTNVVEGEGLMLVVTVGPYTEWGKLMLGLQEERKDTPLQEKLDHLANLIGYGGGAVAILLFIILTINWAVQSGAKDPDIHILNFLIIAITIVVVAVPEGLPLAVTISLAYSMKKMLLDNNFVRHLKACETMGNATTICSDKTGTLTTNRMSVQQLFMYEEHFTRAQICETPEIASQALHPTVHELLMNAICANTKSFQEEPKTDDERAAIEAGKRKKRLTGGNQTDCAMLQFAIDIGAKDYKERRKNSPVTKMFPFDSKVKRSSVLVKVRVQAEKKYVMYAKGAAEVMLETCSHFMGKNGEQVLMTEHHKAQVLQAMGRMTRRGLRCLGTSYKRFHKSEIPFSMNANIADEDCGALFQDMVWMAVTGIQDPVRDEVPDAVRTCQRAGIVVRMVTGDHLETAKHIAKECHILTCSDHVCMTGAQFRALSEEEKLDQLPRLRVLARSKPKDKEQLVKWYKENNNDIVATTGDGANDALALKEANIGLSMGIQGTDVAKEASDIIIMDDNFASIVQTVMWGRSVYDNIRKFVQFQLTVNVVALTISLIAAFWPEFQNPLTAVQLLWVNLIMDTMAALALATEDPTPALLDRHPFSPNSPLITQVLWRFVFGHSFYQLVLLLFTMFLADEWLDIRPMHDDEDQNRRHLTIIFNCFVWMQIFNEFNARRVNNEWNIFEHILENMYFWFIMAITIMLQVFMIVFFGDFASTESLNAKEWGYCLTLGAGSLIWHQFVRLIPINLQHGIKYINSDILFKYEPEFEPGYYSEKEKEKEEEEEQQKLKIITKNKNKNSDEIINNNIHSNHSIEIKTINTPKDDDNNHNN